MWLFLEILYVLRYKRILKEIFIVRNLITLQAAISDCAEQPSRAIHSRKFLQKILVVEPFF